MCVLFTDQTEVCVYLDVGEIGFAGTVDCVPNFTASVHHNSGRSCYRGNLVQRYHYRYAVFFKNVFSSVASCTCLLPRNLYGILCTPFYRTQLTRSSDLLHLEFAHCRHKLCSYDVERETPVIVATDKPRVRDLRYLLQARVSPIQAPTRWLSGGI